VEGVARDRIELPTRGLAAGKKNQRGVKATSEEEAAKETSTNSNNVD